MIIFVEGDEIINTTFVIFCMFGFIACNDQDQNETEEQVFLKKLSGQEWSAMAVAVDGKDVTSSFEGLSVRFTETGTYSVANAVAPIWSSAGAFELQPTPTGFSIMRDDGVLITVRALEEKHLVLSFQYTADLSGRRLHSIGGIYTFDFE